MKKILFSATSLLLTIGTVFAADPPPMKEGYWSIHTVTIDQPGDKKQETNRSICRNHAYDQYVQELAKKQSAACKVTESSSGGTRTTESECTVAGTVVRSKGTVTGAGENAAHSETTATYTPPMGGMSGMTMIMDQKFMGACPAGVVPGDMITADGRKTNNWKH
jgi:hypothetical protein